MLSLRLRLLAVVLLALWLALPLAQAASPAARFTGEISCASSGCHGGGKGKDQCLLFNKKDIHTHAHEILANNRSARIVETLGIADATKDARCTVCHSPQQNLAESRLVAGVKSAAGVSCESCHGAAEPWLRFHTRTDISHEQRVGAGLREAGTLYAKANICIACHLNVDQQLITAGHPEMFFELDGQIRAEPPHWDEEKDTWLGPRTWLVGQAAALRELSWKVANQPDEELATRWRAGRWLLQQLPAGAGLPAAQISDYRAVQSAADRIARNASAQRWSKESTLTALRKLASLSSDFREASTPQPDHRRRAELIILGVDRLWQAMKSTGLVSPNLETALAVAAQETRKQQALDPGKFAAALEQVEVAMELLPK